MKKKEFIISITIQRIFALIGLFAASIWNILCIVNIVSKNNFLYGTYALVGSLFVFFLLKMIFPELKVEKSVQFKSLTIKEKMLSYTILFLLGIWIVTYFIFLILE